MQGETTQQTLMIERSNSPQDSETDVGIDKPSVAERGYSVEIDDAQNGIDNKIIRDKHVDQDDIYGPSPCGSGNNQPNLSPRSAELEIALENKDFSKRDSNQLLNQLYQSHAHPYGERVDYRLPEPHGFYMDAHSLISDGTSNQHAVLPPPLPLQQPSGGWPHSHIGMPYAGCDDHPFSHGYFIMPYYPATGLPMLHTHISPNKQVQGTMSDAPYPENIVFPEAVHHSQMGFPYSEQGRNLPRLPMTVGNTQTQFPNHAYNDISAVRPQGLPPFWPSFAEKTPALGCIKDYNSNSEISLENVNENREMVGVTVSQPQTYLYLPPVENSINPSDNEEPKNIGEKRARNRKDTNSKGHSRAKIGTDSIKEREICTNKNTTPNFLPCECKWITEADTGDEKRVCDGHFETPTDLAKHLSTDHVYRGDHQVTFICLWEGCQRQNRPFKARYKLVNHLRVHTGERPYKCKHPGCERTFARTENLKIHARGHSGEKPYTCPINGCNKKFSNSSDRKKHQRSHEIRS